MTASEIHNRISGTASGLAGGPEDHKPDPVVWRRLVEGIKVQSIVLTEMKASRERKIENSKLTPRIAFNSKIGAADVSVNLFEARFGLTFEAFVDGEATPVCRISLEYALVYFHTELRDFPVMYAEEFVRVNVPYHAWPYVRQKLQATTAEMALPPYVLQPLLVGPVSRPENKK